VAGDRGDSSALSYGTIDAQSQSGYRPCFEGIFALQYIRAIGRVCIWIITFFGLGAIAADMLKRWMDRNGYLDHPDQGLAWLVSIAAAIVDQWWFYPALAFVAGLSVGLSLDALLRRLSSDTASRRKSLGYDMMDMAESLKRREVNQRSAWPANCHDLRPEIDSLFIRSMEERIYAPDQKIYRLANGQTALWDHFDFVGSYLVNEHLKVARKRALRLKEYVDETNV
jgi:hypothetical protein